MIHPFWVNKIIKTINDDQWWWTNDENHALIIHLNIMIDLSSYGFFSVVVVVLNSLLFDFFLFCFKQPINCDWNWIFLFKFSNYPLIFFHWIKAGKPIFLTIIRVNKKIYQIIKISTLFCCSLHRVLTEEKNFFLFSYFIGCIIDM